MNRFLIFVISGLAGALIANKKGRSTLRWGLICFFVPPAVFLLFFLPPVVAEGKTKRCPYCGHVLPSKDTSCKFCKKELPIEMIRCTACGSFVPDKEYCIHCNRKLK